MRSFKTFVFLFALAAVIALALLFTFQNLDQTVELGLNLGPLGAWRFSRPQPAVYVILGAFAGGLVLVGLLAVLELIVFQRRLRQLRREIQALRGGAATRGGA